MTCITFTACNKNDSAEPIQTTVVETTTEELESTTEQGTVEGYSAEEEEGVKLNEDEYQGDNPYDKEVDNYEGMTPEQIAQQLIADYLKDNAQTGQIHVDIPGATPGDPSQDGTTPDYNIDLPDWAHGDFIN